LGTRRVSYTSVELEEAEMIPERGGERGTTSRTTAWTPRIRPSRISTRMFEQFSPRSLVESFLFRQGPDARERLQRK